KPRQIRHGQNTRHAQGKHDGRVQAGASGGDSNRAERADEHDEQPPRRQHRDTNDSTRSADDVEEPARAPEANCGQDEWGKPAEPANVGIVRWQGGPSPRARMLPPAYGADGVKGSAGDNW